MFKSLFLNKNIYRRFCTKLDIYPDQIVDHVRKNITGKYISDIEATIINNIHFFDSDQYTDLFVTFAKNDRGSNRFWDLLSRKIYDYNFDTAQRFAMLEASEKTLKHSEDIMTYLAEPFLRRLASEETRNKLSVYEKVHH
jgi:hypothetical protein